MRPITTAPVFILPPELADDPLFHWLLDHADAELWAPRLPIVVTERCGSQHALLATWLAIYRLLLLYRPLARTDLSIREIAALAHVSRARLTGARGYIQQLVDRGLLQITGSVPVPGLPAGRAQYVIDMQRLETESAVLARQTIATGQRPLPQRRPPDPQQPDLFLPETTTAADPGGACNAVPHAAPPALLSPHPYPRTATTDQAAAPDAPCGTAAAGGAVRDGTAAPTDKGRVPVSPVPALAPDAASSHLHVMPVLAPDGVSIPLDSDADTPHGHPHPATLAPDAASATPVSASGASMGSHGCQPLASHGAVGGKEGRTEGRERGNEPPLTRTAILDLIQHTITTALQHSHIQYQRSPDMTPPATSTIPLPPTPTGQPPLPAPLAVLWDTDRPAPTHREHLLLHELAGEADQSSGGYGAYWLGRAILKAELALSDRQTRPSIAYVRGVLRRWMTEASWGSDLHDDAGMRLPPTAPAVPPAPPPGSAAREPAAPAAPTVPASAADPAMGEPAAPAAELEVPLPPAVQQYAVCSGRQPPPRRARLIAQTVTDQDAWQAVLDDWKQERHDFGNLDGLLDRYQREVALQARHGARPPHGTPPLSDMAIIGRTDLDHSIRTTWRTQFHATPAHKRAAVLAAFAAQYPLPHHQEGSHGSVAPR